MNRKLLLVVLSSIVLLTSCAKKTPGAGQGAGAGEGGAYTQGYGAGTDAGGFEVANCALPPQAAGNKNSPLYFDFDKSDIRSGYNAELNQIAQMAASNPGMKIRIDGNTDDRGSREYNIGLGWRRANAVTTALKQYGVKPSQITTISYGAEKPIAFGTTEADYQCNRRVDVIYKGQ